MFLFQKMNFFARHQLGKASKKKKEILAEVSGVGVREGLRGQIFFIRSVF